jgi:hypothetical protein
VELGRWVAQVRDAYAPDKTRDRDKTQYEQRALSGASTFQGLGVGSWTLPGALQETVMTAIHAFSAPIPGDDRSPAQRRADALVTIAELALAAGQAPESGGVKPHVTVLLPLDTLEQRAGAPAASYGYGASTAAGSDWARRICCDALISRVITDPASQPLDLGRTTRTFTPAQRRGIIARDQHCIWPGCTMPAAWCEAHHRIHWADGGHTNLTDGVLICGRHHDRVHLQHLAILINPDGTRTINRTPGSADDPPHDNPWDRGHPGDNGPPGG